MSDREHYADAVALMRVFAEPALRNIALAWLAGDTKFRARLEAAFRTEFDQYASNVKEHS